MLRVILLALAAITAVIIYFINLTYKKRQEMDGLPCPPVKKRLFGNLDIAEECSRLFSGCHPHNWLPYIQRNYNLGDVFYLDWWPLGPRWLIITNPELVSQYISIGNSLPKSPLTFKYLHTFLGVNNMVSVEGQQWKTLRSIFNPGFSAGHLMTLVPYIVDASAVFDDVLREKAKTNELFELEEMSTRLAIDIIGKVVLDADFDSQKATHPIVSTFRERVKLMPEQPATFDWHWLEYRRRFKLWRNGHELDRLIGEELDRKMASRVTADSTATTAKLRKRSVIDLALDASQKEYMGDTATKSGSIRSMNQRFRMDAIDSMKTFIFAGHDTTASTIAYTFYLLHFHPECHVKVAAELDAIFGVKASTASIAAAIKADPYIINKLEYTTAVLKETLRIFPPASTLRAVPAESDPSKAVYMTHPETGKKYPLSGFDIWPAANIIHRNEKFFPDPMKFVPERFIQSQTPYPDAAFFTPAGKDAWQPFSKGIRNCIGQELAMIESKVILAMTLRDLDFTAEYNGVKCETVEPIESHLECKDGRTLQERGTIEGHPCYQVILGAAKPKDGMPGRIKLRTS